MVLYSFLFTLGVAAALPCFLYKSIYKKKYRHGLCQRLVFFKTPPITKPIWVHAVSVGELNAAGTLIARIHQEYPDIPLLITTTTDTAASLVRARYGDSVAHLYTPLDFRRTIKRFYRLIQPRCLIIMETELWPNMISCAKQHNVPVFVVNARLSTTSFQRYHYFRWFVRPLLQHIQTICTQSAIDHQRFLDLGAPASRMHMVGSFKYDVASTLASTATPCHFVAEPGTLWLVAASTHPGEEQLCLNIFRQLRSSFPNLHLVLAPRHPERVNTILQLISTETVQRYSQLKHMATPHVVKEDILLIDTIGDLPSLYRQATLIIMGGSFIPHGGQNPLEPAAFAKPILTGPHTENFSEIVHVLKNNGGLQQVTAAELLTTCQHWLNHPQEAKDMGLRAQQVITKHAGATEKTWQQIKLHTSHVFV